MLVKKIGLAFILACTTLSTSHAVWDIDTVDAHATDDIGWYASLAIDGSNNPHIAYFDNTNNDLKYARWTGAAWAIEVVDGAGRSCGEYASLGLDSSGFPHIAYESNSITCASWNGSSWNIANVGDPMTVGYGASLAVGTDNTIHISYADNSYDYIHYAKYNGTSWAWEQVISGSPMDNSIVLDTSNNPYIAFVTNSDNVYIRQWNGSTWVDRSPPTTGETDGYWPSIALDGSNNPRVSFCELNASEEGNLRYYSYSGASWQAVEDPDTTGTTTSGQFSSLAIDSSNYSHISYHDHDNWKLKYATNKSGSWVIETIDPATNQYFTTSLKLDATQQPHIAYYDISNKDLKYAKWINGAYSISGTIRDGGGTPQANVFVFLSGNNIEAITKTNSSGAYTFNAIPTGNYSVTPTLVGYAFAPTMHSYASLSANQSNQNFTISTASGGSFIRGYVTDSQGYAVDQVQVNLTGASAGSYTTTTNGYYEFNNLPGGDYTVTPFRQYWSFSPASRDYTSLSVDQDSQGYSGSSTVPTPTPVVVDGEHTISGYCQDANGSPISGVTVTLSGDQQGQFVTQEAGFYSFGNLLENSSFTITASKQDQSFTPSSRPYSNLLHDIENQNYIGLASDAAPNQDEVKVVTSIFKPNEVDHSSILINISKAGRVVVKVYTIDGTYVAQLLDEELVAGSHALTWAGTNVNDQVVGSGIYFVEIKTPTYRKMKKICIVK